VNGIVEQVDIYVCLSGMNDMMRKSRKKSLERQGNRNQALSSMFIFIEIRDEKNRKSVENGMRPNSFPLLN